MARQSTDTVKYFPHSCTHGKTMFILEENYGNDGYAFWFKLLELLGASEGHFYDYSNEANAEFLQAKTRFLGVKCEEILDKLARLDAIDRNLWFEHKIIWSDNFINGISDAYKNRKRAVPKKPTFDDEFISTGKTDISTSNNPKESNKTEQSTPNNPQTKLNETKLNETKLNNNKNNNRNAGVHEDISTGNNSEDNLYPSNSEGNAAEETAVTLDPGGQSLELSIGENPDFMMFWNMYPKKKKLPEAMQAWQSLIHSGIEAQHLVQAAVKYGKEFSTGKIDLKYCKSPEKFLGEGAYKAYLPMQITVCPTCQFQSRCKGQGFYLEDDGTGYQKTFLCPYKGESA